MERELKKDSMDASFLPDGGRTIKSSGMFGTVSAFIPTLTFLSGPALGKEIPIVQRQMTVGRGSDCDIIIADPAVSRKHLQIYRREIVKKGQSPKIKIVLCDLGSSNGTLVNYASARKTVLKPGDKIFLGRTILKFDHRDVAEQSFFDEIYRLATTDSLTSLLNKASITRTLSEEIADSARYRRWMSVILMDIDKFKSMNDLNGHLAGDRILQCVANILHSTIRKRDKAGRFGGDEFLIILPETGSKGAIQVAERIRKMIETTISPELGMEAAVTASLGIASGRANIISAENLLENADVALYRAKSLGRNRAEAWKKSLRVGGDR
ncbi:MAG: diguanylate cyclase [Acidobacteria bacterium]|nr:diguanylate cyclase [Acidobacteriota bacterium]